MCFACAEYVQTTSQGQLEQQDARQELANLMAQVMSKRQMEAATLLLGLNGQRPLNGEEAGKMLGIGPRSAGATYRAGMAALMKAVAHDNRLKQQFALLLQHDWDMT